MDNIFMILILIGIGGIFYFRKKDKKKRNISIVVAIASLVLFGITSPDVKEEPSKEEPEQVEEETAEEPEPETEEEREDQEEPADDKTSAELPDELKDLRVTDVRGDTTGNWKKVVDSKNFNMPENAIAYAEEYMEDGEIHYLVSFATNTTTMINNLGGMLLVNITEYENKEEHSADTIGNGMIYKSYNVYKDDGTIEDLDEVDE